MLDRPANIVVEGPSAAGKNHLVSQVVRLFPPEAVYVLTASSARVLALTHEDFQHRALVIGESAGLHRDGIGATLLRTLVWEGRLVYETIEKTRDGLRPRRIEKAGPTGFITTTTTSLDPELATRVLTITVRDDRHQSRLVVRAAGRRAAQGPVEVDLAPFVAAQRWLAAAGTREVIVPFGEVLADLVDVSAVRVRRDFVQLLTLIRASALLHQCRRPRDDRGRVVATLEDYRIVHGLVTDVFAATAADDLTPAQREAALAVGRLFTESGREVTLRHVAEHLGIDKSAASRRLTRPIEKGYVINLEERNGKPARYQPGDDLPEHRNAIPDPEVLATACERVRIHPPEDDNNGATSGPEAASDTVENPCTTPLPLGDRCAGPSSPTAPLPATGASHVQGGEDR